MAPDATVVCSTCGKDMTDLGRIDGDAATGGQVLYGCSACGNAVTLGSRRG